MLSHYCDYLKALNSDLKRRGIYVLDIQEDKLWSQVQILEELFYLNDKFKQSGGNCFIQSQYTETPMSYLRSSIYREYLDTWYAELEALTRQPEDAGEIDISSASIESFIEKLGLNSGDSSEQVEDESKLISGENTMLGEADGDSHYGNLPPELMFFDELGSDHKGYEFDSDDDEEPDDDEDLGIGDDFDMDEDEEPESYEDEDEDDEDFLDESFDTESDVVEEPMVIGEEEFDSDFGICDFSGDVSAVYNCYALWVSDSSDDEDDMDIGTDFDDFDEEVEEDDSDVSDDSEDEEIDEYEDFDDEDSGYDEDFEEDDEDSFDDYEDFSDEEDSDSDSDYEVDSYEDFDDDEDADDYDDFTDDEDSDDVDEYEDFDSYDEGDDSGIGDDFDDYEDEADDYEDFDDSDEDDVDDYDDFDEEDEDDVDDYEDFDEEDEDDDSGIGDDFDDDEESLDDYMDDDFDDYDDDDSPSIDDYLYEDDEKTPKKVVTSENPPKTPYVKRTHEKNADSFVNLVNKGLSFGGTKIKNKLYGGSRNENKTENRGNRK